MGTEYKPSIFKVNPEYRSWKNESAGISSDYSPLPTTQDTLALPSVLETRLEKYEEKAAGPWEKAVKNWVTEKARVTEMVNFFPSDTVIPQVAVKADDKVTLKDAMFSLLKEGENCLGIRTCYFPDRLGTAPFSMGEIKDENGIADFLREKYPTWLKTEARGRGGEHLEEIIVQANPPLFGKAGEENRHFVFITIEDEEPRRLLTEVSLNTFHLRSIEEGRGKDDFVEINQPIVPGQIFRAHSLQTSIGRKHWNEELTKEVSSLIQKTVEPMRQRFNPMARLKGLTGKELMISNFEQVFPKEDVFVSEWPDDEPERLGSEVEDMCQKYIEKVAKHSEFRETARKIASLIFDPYYILGATSPIESSIWGNIDQAISNGTIPNNLCEELINPRTWEATNNLKRIIHQEWLSPPMDIYLRLMALNNVCVLPEQKAESGYCAVEVQGAYDPKGKIEYAKIYAIRGREEKEFAARAKGRLTTWAI